MNPSVIEKDDTVPQVFKESFQERSVLCWIDSEAIALHFFRGMAADHFRCSDGRPHSLKR